MTRSPHRKMTVEQLERIQANHYQSATKEFSECELDQDLWEKRQKRADREDPEGWMGLMRETLPAIRKIVSPPPPPMPDFWECFEYHRELLRL